MVSMVSTSLSPLPVIPHAALFFWFCFSISPLPDNDFSIFHF
jgi:hypothetical protein